MDKEEFDLTQNNDEASIGQKPLVAVVGRKNVGKSTLFNRLANKRIAIVKDEPGTTRDRLTIDVDVPEGSFTLMDTGGLEADPNSTIEEQINYQIGLAMQNASVIIFLVNNQEGLMPDDYEIADMLRKIEKPVLLVANKADNDKSDINSYEFAALGFGEPITISSYHGRGITELLQALEPYIKSGKKAHKEEKNTNIRLTIVGRPNVGKSHLLNAITGEDRSIVSNIPGTTRDPIDTTIQYKDKTITLVDTAGLKKRGKQTQGIDKYSVLRSHDAIERSDIAVLVLDTSELLTEQDLHIAGFIQEAYKGLVIVVNKWDLADDETSKMEVRKYIQARMKFFDHAPIVFTSAITGYGVKQIIPEAIKVYGECTKRVSTAQLNNVMQMVTGKHAPPHKLGKHLKFLYATQAAVLPPTFVFFVNDASIMHFSYERYIINQLRASYGFAGTPIKLTFKSRAEKEKK